MKDLLNACFHQALDSVIRTLLVATLLTVLFVIPQQPVGAQAGPTIRLVPASSQIAQDGTVTTEVRLENVSNLVKIKFVLVFEDPAVVQVVGDADPGVPGQQIPVGGLIDENWAMHRNEVHNNLGEIKFGYLFSGDASEPVTGSGPVAFISWRGVGAGTSSLRFEAVELPGSPGVPIAHGGSIQVGIDTATPTPTETSFPTDTPTFTPTPTDTPTITPTPTDTPMPTSTSTPTQMPTHTPSPTFTATPIPTIPIPDTPTATPIAVDTPTVIPLDMPMPTPTATSGQTPLPTSKIVGVVLLQGRAIHAGTNIHLSEEACSGTISGPLVAITDDPGYFEFTPDPGRVYQCLQASKPGYLIGQRASPQGDLGAITLLGGDVDGDNVIDNDDLVFIRDDYRSEEPTLADVNADGWVDIYDLSMASGNFGQNGALIPWQ